ncbi:tripartite tricarboxylate transporter permease [Pseudooceanicola nanhaiensis]|uniref:tripartite tricarboxylate transporter permease n=1 Tax=Pseudooceanicola nanhaiensis TaxID=375761 RepID=UPI001CD2395A|nr:tripartite tricarboxylate transporter permease [Pseudooceanicola nanhaiensis]MCA0919774.1 tripartite tricarboxylate transporter permease [Pseudooceanicola nanhaiensis]
MDLVLQYIGLGVTSVFTGAEGGLWLMPLAMVVVGVLVGILVGATPGLSGPFAMAIALPVLVSIFGYSNEALYPVLGCLVGIMKGATVGGAVPAILFNTPGTPDAFLTTLDGNPMARKGLGRKAIQTAHFSSVMGDNFSDIVLFVAAPIIAVGVERVLGLPEKSALIILSLCFMAAVVGGAPLKGLIGGLLGMFVSLVGSTLSGNGPRLTFGIPELGGGLPLTSCVLGVLVLSEVLISIEDMRNERRRQTTPPEAPEMGPKLTWGERGRMLPGILRGATIGTLIGALPGIGTTTAATLSYDTAKRRSKEPESFGQGNPQGVVATESANSAVSGANLIPVMSLGIPGNFAAVFIILAVETIGDFAFGPQVFRFTPIREIEGFDTILNKDLVMAFGLFTMMVMANAVNWTVGGFLMGLLGYLVRIPKDVMLPVILTVSLTAAYVQDGGYLGLLSACGFALIGYALRRLDISILPFVIGFLLAPTLEGLVRGAYTASGGDALFLVKSPISLVMLALSVFLLVRMVRQARRA